MTEELTPAEDTAPDDFDQKIDFDYERAGALLNIVEQVSKVAPGYTAISGEAMRELKEMNDALTKIGQNRAKILKAKADYEIAKRAEAAREVKPEEQVDPAPSPSEEIERSRRAALAKASLETTAGTAPIRRTL